MIDSVIFDMDGTILNTLDDLTESVNFTVTKFGFPSFTSDEVKYFVGNGVDILFQRALPENCNRETFQGCIKTFKTHYAKNMFHNTKPYNGIIDLMQNLKVSGVKLGVVSNKFDSAVKELSNKYFKGLIDASIGQSVDIPPKPEPSGVLKCAKELNAKNFVYVGDSDVDVQTAKNAGVPVIGVTWGFRDLSYLDGADYIANRPEELKDILMGFIR